MLLEGNMKLPRIYPDNCPFCIKIDNKDNIESTTYLDKGVPIVRFTPLNPVVPGHKLFVPRYHYEHHTPMAVAAIMRAASNYGSRQETDFNLILSSGTDATQTIDHMHGHYVPRTAHDGLMLPWSKW